MTYKSVLMQDVPNLANLFGYTNASWTLKVDLAANYICRLLNHMDRHGYDVVTPIAPAGEMLEETVMDSCSPVTCNGVGVPCLVRAVRLPGAFSTTSRPIARC
jgi:cation diffusion facilitator CzcD-associated flavoprotein CzcO